MLRSAPGWSSIPGTGCICLLAESTAIPTLQHGVLIYRHCREIDDDVYFGPGSKVMYPVRIGHRARVGPTRSCRRTFPTTAQRLGSRPGSQGTKAEKHTRSLQTPRLDRWGEFTPSLYPLDACLFSLTSSLPETPISSSGKSLTSGCSMSLGCERPQLCKGLSFHEAEPPGVHVSQA